MCLTRACPSRRSGREQLEIQGHLNTQVWRAGSVTYTRVTATMSHYHFIIIWLYLTDLPTIFDSIAKASTCLIPRQALLVAPGDLVSTLNHLKQWWWEFPSFRRTTWRPSSTLQEPGRGNFNPFEHQQQDRVISHPQVPFTEETSQVSHFLFFSVLCVMLKQWTKTPQPTTSKSASFVVRVLWSREKLNQIIQPDWLSWEFFPSPKPWDNGWWDSMWCD